MRFRNPLFIRSARFNGTDALSGFVLDALTSTLEVDFVTSDVDVTLLSSVPVIEFLLSRYARTVFFDKIHRSVFERAVSALTR